MGTHPHRLAAPLPTVQPVVGDWQQRVKQAKRQQRSEAAAAAGAAQAAAATQPTAETAGGKPDLDALSQGLPDGWRAMWDAGHSRVYFGNLQTQARVQQGGAAEPCLAPTPAAATRAHGLRACTRSHLLPACMLAQQPASPPPCLPVLLPNARLPARYR